MKAQWLEVWRVGYQLKTSLDPSAWEEPMEECVLAAKDGAAAVELLREAALATVFAESDGMPSLVGKPMYCEFRLLRCEHVARAALFQGLVQLLPGLAKLGGGKR